MALIKMGNICFPLGQALCNEKIDDLPAFVDDDMELEPKEPPHTSPALFGYPLEYPVLFFPFAMAYLYQGGIHKGYSRTLAQTTYLKEQYHRDHRLLLQLHKTVVRYHFGKILPQMFTDMVEIKVLKATVSLLVE